MKLPELTPLATAPSLPRPGPGGRVLGAVFFVLALVVFGLACSRIAYAGGLAGSPGTLTATSCHALRAAGSSHPTSGPTVCEGTFRSDDGRSTDEVATVRADATPGDRIAVQGADGEYVRTGPGEVARWIALFFSGWLVAAFGVPFAATGMLPRSGVQAALINRSVSGTRAGTVRNRLYLVGLGGAAVSLLVTWML
ncbi:hypothetical protein [Streptomyces natalensis]|uniref:Uncharacterized protein n=1 Tax=Streptomyces natalensis ATCC 27448 TaxID=1240678 RepID=A0A0D7CD67_9ACTN|nr:hypothetical protein [Streptomyces natalensis]KIZ13825.1 hypothetical protein SNA_32305 [Streptomyces natalensis ATCC 27448]